MKPLRIVGIGASANGLEAIYEFFDHMPPDTGMAFVVVQHFSPEFKSLMHQLLPNHTKMPVKVVDEDVQPESNHIYLISARKNITIENGILKPIARFPANSINLPVDVFFHALALDQEDKAIGIILSGASTDGSRGARSIKETGGFVMVQDPETTEFDGMPSAAISIGVADVVLPSFSLAKELVRIVQNPLPNLPKAIDMSDEKNSDMLSRVLNRVAEVTGVDFSEYRRGTLIRRTEKRMQMNNIGKLEEYYHLLLMNETEYQQLFKEFLIGVTRFFRDKDAFESLRINVLPIVAENAKSRKEIRIWVVGCASGEEAYSIGIALQEYLAAENLSNQYKIFATDVDKDAITVAGEGLYPDSIANDIEARLLDKYFVAKANNRYQVHKNLREKIVFAVHDALQDPPFIHMDLIVCRNMPIYLTPKMQQSLYTNFQFALNYQGFLFLGPSETVGAAKKVFELVDPKWKIYKNIATSRIGSLPGRHFRERSLGTESNPQLSIALGSLHRSNDGIFSNILAQRFAPRSMFVNENLEILYLNGDFDELLYFPRLTKLNLTEIIGENDGLIFKNGIRKVDETGTPIVYRNLPFKKKNKEYVIDLQFEKLNPKDLNSITVYLIEFYIKGEGEASSSKTVEEVNLENFKDERLLMLDLELQKVRQEKQYLVEQLETANEELQSSNEELLAANEELQSSNEELQSLNEELYTVNTELQAKIDELTEIHTDTNNLLKSTEIGTIFLDRSLRIRKFTPALQQQFNLLDTDIGRPITHFTNTFKDDKIYDEIKSVFDDLVKVERAVVDKDGKQFLMRILPYRSEQDNVSGVVITFVNVTSLVEAKAEVLAGEEKFQAIFDNAPVQITLTNREGKVIASNFRYPHFHAIKIGEPLFKYLTEDCEPDFKKAYEKAKESGNKSEILHHSDGHDGNKNWFTTEVVPVFSQQHLVSMALISKDGKSESQDGQDGHSVLKVKESVKEEEV